MTQTIEQLTARVRELEEENARLHEQVDLQIPAIVFKQLTEHLAAEQLNNKLLREALQAYIDEHEECQDADAWMAMMCSMEAHHVADEALAQPSDTSALDAYVAEKVSAARNIDEKQIAYLFEERSALNRQRNLAVEAITRAIDMVGHPDNIAYLQQTLDAIKESEGK